MGAEERASESARVEYNRLADRASKLLQLLNCAQSGPQSSREQEVRTIAEIVQDKVPVISLEQPEKDSAAFRLLRDLSYLTCVLHN